MRSKDASTASAAAGEAMGLDDQKAALTKCLQARNELVNARSRIADVGLKKFEGLGDLYDIKEKEAKVAEEKQVAANNEANPAEKQRLQKESDEARARSNAAANKLTQELAR
jgi:hypothetical protein